MAGCCGRRVKALGQYTPKPVAPESVEEKSSEVQEQPASVPEPDPDPPLVPEAVHTE